MKVDVVTGACGFSGNYVVKHLLEKGRKVRATDLEGAYDKPQSVEFRKLLDVDYERDGVEWVPADLTKKETLAPLFKKGDVGCLFHTASLYDYSAPWEALERINIGGVTNLLEAAVEGKVGRMIHWSTCGVYGHSNFPGSYLEGWPGLRFAEMAWNLLVRPWQKDPTFKRPARRPTNQPMSEDHVSTPKNTEGDTPTGTDFSNEYSRSKWKQEQTVWKYHREKGLPVTVVRPAPIYGPGTNYGATGLVMELAEGVTPVYAAGSKDFLFGGNVHARDMARAVVFLSEKPESIGEDYNVSDACLVTHREAIEFAMCLLGRKIYFVPGLPMSAAQKLIMSLGKLMNWLDRRYPQFRRSRIYDLGQLNYLTLGVWIPNKKLKSLGFEFEYPDFKQGVADTIAWLIQNGKIQ